MATDKIKVRKVRTLSSTTGSFRVQDVRDLLDGIDGLSRLEIKHGRDETTLEISINK